MVANLHDTSAKYNSYEVIKMSDEITTNLWEKRRRNKRGRKREKEREERERKK